MAFERKQFNLEGSFIKITTYECVQEEKREKKFPSCDYL